MGVSNARNHNNKDDKIRFSPTHDDALIVAGNTTKEPTIEASSPHAYRSIIVPNSGNNFSVMPPISELRKHNTTAQSLFFHAEQFEKFAFFFCPTFIFGDAKRKVGTRAGHVTNEIMNVKAQSSFNPINPGSKCEHLYLETAH